MRAKILAAALIFLALTIVRIAFPNTVSMAKEKLAPVTAYGEILAKDIVAIGKRITGNGGAVYAWEKKNTPENSAEPALAVSPEGFNLEEMVSSNLMGFSDFAVESFIPPEFEDPMETAYIPPSEPLPEETPTAENQLQNKINAFLTEQAAVTDLAMPDSICLDAVILDFEYAAPVKIAYTSAFGYRLHPIYDDMRFHYGTDFPAYSGDAIGAFADGTVIAAQEFDGYGTTVIIDHGNGFTSLYAHCSVLYVSLGDSVTIGQTIALVGATGNVTGPHLHFELQKGDMYLNPEFYL